MENNKEFEMENGTCEEKDINDKPVFEEEKARKEFEISRAKAEKELNNHDAIEDLLRGLEKKLKNLPVLNDSLSYIPAMCSMVKSIIEGKYKKIPEATLFAILGALAYFLSPIDAIPDFIPIVGLIDDAAVVAICLKLAQRDIDEYIEWRDNKAVEEKN